MKELEATLDQLVVANRILANEAIVDAYGHVSVRHPKDPGRYFQARSLAPELVRREDIMEFHLDGRPASGDTRTPYLERFIHGAIFEARPDVQAVIHAHAEDVLPFTITRTPLRPVIHSGSFIGAQVPVWDIAERFGDKTNLLVVNMAQGRDLAQSLGARNVVLMRGHGFSAAARSVVEAVRMSVYLARNARAQFKAMQLGEFKPLSQGEIDARNTTGYKPDSPETQRAWEYWATRAGCAELLKKPG